MSIATIFDGDWAKIDQVNREEEEDPIEKLEKSLLRFSIVGPLLAAPAAQGELQAELEKLAGKQWPLSSPFSAPVRQVLSCRTTGNTVCRSDQFAAGRAAVKAACSSCRSEG